MSILITGLEMPTERESFNLTIKYNGVVLDTETGVQVAEAHELPAHGRLIDNDELGKLLEKYWSEFAQNASESRDYNLMYEAFGIRDAKLVADGLPIIIPADKDGEKDV